MCNCNQKRSMFSSQNARPPEGMVKVRLTDKKPLLLRGDITGRMYVFRNENDLLLVDSRDAMSMKEMRVLQVLY
jgi:hypothetical protein